MSMEIVPDAFYNTSNLADILGLSLHTIQKLLQNKELPGFKVGHRWFVLGSALLALGKSGDIEGAA